MSNVKEFEHVEELVSLAAALQAHANESVKLTVRMANVGIFTNALEEAYVSATAASHMVGTLADAHLLAKAREISPTVVQETAQA